MIEASVLRLSWKRLQRHVGGRRQSSVQMLQLVALLNPDVNIKVTVMMMMMMVMMMMMMMMVMM